MTLFEHNTAENVSVGIHTMVIIALHRYVTLDYCYKMYCRILVHLNIEYCVNVSFATF